MLNEFRLGWGRNDSFAAQDPFGLNTLASVGILGVQDNPIYSGGLPGLSINGGGGVPQAAAGGGLGRLGSPDFSTWPYEGSGQLTNLDPSTGQIITPANSPFGKGLVQPDKNNPNAVAPRTVRLRAVNPQSVMPSVDQWNVGLQRMLPDRMVLTLDYIGTKGTHLSVLRNLNQAPFNPDGTTTCLYAATCTTIPYPNLIGGAVGPIEYWDNMGNSIYHGLESIAK